MIRKLTGQCFGLAAVLLTAHVAVAQNAPAAPKPSFKDVLGAGYEIKSVAYLPKEALGTDDPQILVTLQKGSSVATCQFYSGNWAALITTSLEGVTQCTLYPSFVR